MPEDIKNTVSVEDSELQNTPVTDFQPKWYSLRVKGRFLLALVIFNASVAFLLFGYDQGVLAGLLTSEYFLSTFGHPDSGLIGTINSVYNLGCFCGAIICFFFGDKLGRRRSILCGLSVMTVGAILQTSAYSVPQLIVGRVITGIGNGMDTATCPVYVSEMVKAERRGNLVSIELNMIALGIVIANYFDIGMSYVAGHIQWRLPIGFQMVFMIISGTMTLILPESPRWLAVKGRHGESLDVLARLHGKHTPTTHPEVVEAKRQIDQVILIETDGGNAKRSDIFKSSPLLIRRRIVLAIGTQAMQQCSGINILVYYAPTVIENYMGYGHQDALYIAAGISVTYYVGSFIPCFFLDQMSRRWSILSGSLVCGLCFLICGILQVNPTVERAKATLAFFYIYEFAFAWGWLAVPWVYPPEISQTRYRAQIASLSTASNWIFNYLVVQITPIAFSDIGWKTWIVFTILNFVFIFVVFLFYPETSGISLEEVDFLFQAYDNSLFVFKKKRSVRSIVASNQYDIESKEGHIHHEFSNVGSN
jgi:sugar porter (SP) family MFS transporter